MLIQHYGDSSFNYLPTWTSKGIEGVGICFGSGFGSLIGTVGINAVGCVVVGVFVIAVFVNVVVVVCGFAMETDVDGRGSGRGSVGFVVKKRFHEGSFGALLVVLVADDRQRLRRWRHVIRIFINMNLMTRHSGKVIENIRYYS